MKTKRAFVLILSILVCIDSLGQQRLGVDINTSGLNLYANISYQKILSEKFILQSGVFGGYLDYSAELHEKNEIQNGLVVKSPFESVNLDRSRNGNSYKLQSYTLRGRGFGIHAGMGIFHEFSTVHGIKFFVNGRLGYSWTEVLSKYHNPDAPKEIEELNTFGHFFTAISPEIYHTIRLNGRFTFLYGCKAPYYFLIDRSKYDPVNIKNMFYGLEPEFTLGITYVVGKCDE